MYRLGETMSVCGVRFERARRRAAQLGRAKRNTPASDLATTYMSTPGFNNDMREYQPSS